MFQHHVFGVDMGTGTVKIYDGENDAITKERNMIAVREKDTVFAVGNEAYEMYGRTPQNVDIIKPISNGRINDVLMMEAVLHTLLRRCSENAGYSPVLYFSVPMDMTEIERRAYSTIARKGRFRRARVLMVEKPIADAIALKIPIYHTPGTMLINMGAESTEISIIADKRVIISQVIPIGGAHFTDAIAAGVRKKNNLYISHRTAQRLKFTLTDLGSDIGEGCKVFGIDAENALPRNGIISNYTVSKSVSDVMLNVAEQIKRILERIPPQIRVNVQEEGIFLTGGSTHIPGIDEYLAGYLECPVKVSQYYELSTISGLKEIIKHTEMQHWATTPGKSKGI